MTTIAFLNGILAVDSRSSIPEERLAADDDKSTQRICFHCERPAWVGTDNAVKLVVMPKSEWRGERILTAATTGITKNCASLRRLLNTGKDIKAMWDGYSALAQHRDVPSFRASMVIVTATKLWTLEFHGSTLTSFEEPRDQPFSRGSGGDAAKLAMTAMRATAVEAVWAARAIDPATGGAVRWFDTNAIDLGDKEKKYTPTSEEPMTREEAAVFVRNGFKKPEAVAAKKVTVKKTAVKKRA